jgi:hypothetical protein
MFSGWVNRHQLDLIVSTPLTAFAEADRAALFEKRVS